MRKFWIIFPVGMAVAIGMVGYFGYRLIENTLTIPKDLEPYQSRPAALALIRSKAPAPGPDARLTAEQVDLFVAMLDSINLGTDAMTPALRNLGLDTTKNGRVRPNVLAAPDVVHQALMAPALTRRAIVNFLNNHELSWDQYLWIKERVLAASGITSAEADSSSEANAPRTTRMANAKLRTNDSLMGADTIAFAGTYTYLDELRTRITADEAEAALVTPYRTLILQRARPCMHGRKEEL